MEEPEQEQEQRAGELAADEAAEATHEAAHVAVSSQVRALAGGYLCNVRLCLCREVALPP